MKSLARPVIVVCEVMIDIITHPVWGRGEKEGGTRKKGRREVQYDNVERVRGKRDNKQKDESGSGRERSTKEIRGSKGRDREREREGWRGRD